MAKHETFNLYNAGSNPAGLNLLLLNLNSNVYFTHTIVNIVFY